MGQNYINHLAFIIDESWSMSHRTNDVIKIFENQVEHLAKRSKETDQETRVSVYLFSDEVRCEVFDKDVLRLPSIRGKYRPNGRTALLDATLLAVSDLEKTNTIYGDHSFLCIVLTDGQNNINNRKSRTLRDKIQSLPDNWTVAVMVPDMLSLSDAKSFGFPNGNIQVWDMNKRDMDEVGSVITKVTDNYMSMRSTGTRGTKSLFQLNTSNLKSEIVTKTLDKVSSRDYYIFDIDDGHDGYMIRQFIEENGINFIKGRSFYELMKSETIQGDKKVAVQNKISGFVYSGDEARKLIGLPDGYAIKVSPSNFKNYRIFIQSNSVNRKLVAGTKMLYFKK